MCELEGRFQAAINVGLDIGKFESPRPGKPITNSCFGYKVDTNF